MRANIAAMTKSSVTRRAALGGLAGTAVAPHVAASARVNQVQALDMVDIQRIFIDLNIAEAEAATREGQLFKLLDSARGIATTHRRLASGSELIYAEATLSALASQEPEQGAALLGMVDGASVQQALAVAPSVVKLIASQDQLPVGATVRTANGFVYEVADPQATDAHLTTAGGVKLRSLPVDGCVYAEAFGVVTSDWATDDPDKIVDSTVALQSALNALRSRQTLVLPSGTIYTRNITIPFGTLAVCISGQGTFIPTTVIQFLPGATEGFRLPHEAYEFRNLHIRGADSSGSTLFTAVRTDGYADMDWSFFDCVFTNADHVGYLKGRGLTVDRCLFGKINDDAFVLDHPSQQQFRPGPPDYIQTWEGGFRGFTIRNCRLHNFASHLFRILDNNKENCRGFTITGNQSDGYARVIKGCAQQVNFSANNWYVGWNSADAVLFDLVDSREINIVGNVISNATSARQVGNEPLVRTTGNVQGLNITGNTFGRRDVPVWDGGTATNDRAIRDVTIVNNVYNDCFVTAPFMARCTGASGLVQNVRIDESIYESPVGGWSAVVGDSNWRNASVKVRTRHSDTVVHNIPNLFSHDNERRLGAYLGTGEPLEQFVGYPPKVIRIYTDSGNVVFTSGQPGAITLTATGFTVSASAVVNISGVTYYWEAL